MLNLTAQVPSSKLFVETNKMFEDKFYLTLQSTSVTIQLENSK